MKQQTFYKIRSKSNPDMYVKGTPVYHSYDKSGRIFQGLGPLRTFLTSIMNNEYRRSKLNDWQIVEIKMVVSDTLELHDVVKPEKLIQLLKA
jgi:hypothetical protein